MATLDLDKFNILPFPRSVHVRKSEASKETMSVVGCMKNLMVLVVLVTDYRCFYINVKNKILIVFS